MKSQILRKHLASRERRGQKCTRGKLMKHLKSLETRKLIYTNAIHICSEMIVGNIHSSIDLPKPGSSGFKSGE